MDRARHDSLTGAVTVEMGAGVRGIVVPRDFFPAGPPQWQAWAVDQLPDGRWQLAIGEVDLAEMVVDTVRQIASGTGRVSDRRHDLLRALCTDAEWSEAEMVVTSVDTIRGLPSTSTSSS